MKKLVLITIGVILIVGCSPKRMVERMEKDMVVINKSEGDTTINMNIEEDYTGLDISMWKVILSDSVSQPMVVVDKALLPYIKMKVEGTDLNLGYSCPISMRGNIKSPCLKMPYNSKIKEIELDGAASLYAENDIECMQLSLDLCGSSKAKLEGLKVDDFELDLSGSSKVELQSIEVSGNMNLDLCGSSLLRVRGMTNRLDADISGASNIETAYQEGKYDFVVDSAFIDISGASDMVLHCDGNLDVEASGASSVRYSGNPNIRSEVSGSSDLIKK